MSPFALARKIRGSVFASFSMHNAQRTFSPRRAGLALALLTLGLTGCVMNTSRHRPSDDWLALVKPVRPGPVDLSGSYRPVGKNRGVRNSNGSPYLTDLFFAKDERPTDVRAVELRHKSPTALDVTVLGLSGVLARRTVGITSTPETGAVSLPLRNASFATAEMLGVFAGTTSLTLFKGSDGFLYTRFITRRAGTVIVAIPVAQSDEGWVRWEPIPLATAPAR
jgi:hypothetical protein